MPDLTFVPISKVPKSARASFSCGTDALDQYFHRQAKQDLKRGVAATFVLMEDQAVIGYYTLSAAEIDAGQLPAELRAKMPRYPMLPATRMGRLAVDKRRQRQGWGEKLLLDAMRRAFQNVDVVGSIALVVDAKEEARSFYPKFGFVELVDQRNQLFLPMETVRRAVEAAEATAGGLVL